MLNWSRDDLSQRTGLSVAGIAKIEGGNSNPTDATKHDIGTIFERRGLTFTSHGIEYHKNNITFFCDFIDVLTDAERLLGEGDEILFHCADERRNTKEVTNKFRELEKAGIKLRFTICEGDDFITGDPASYRWVDQDFFANSEVSVTYADKYVIHIEGKEKTFIVIKNEGFSKAMRKQFNYWWDKGKLWERDDIKSA